MGYRWFNCDVWRKNIPDLLISMKHGKARDLHALVCSVLPLLLAYLIFPFLFLFLDSLPKPLKGLTISVVMVYARLFEVNLLLPFILFVVSLTFVNYGLKKVIERVH